VRSGKPIPSPLLARGTPWPEGQPSAAPGQRGRRAGLTPGWPRASALPGSEAEGPGRAGLYSLAGKRRGEEGALLEGKTNPEKNVAITGNRSPLSLHSPDHLMRNSRCTSNLSQSVCV
jgi:hypothetical protein